MAAIAVTLVPVGTVTVILVPTIVVTAMPGKLKLVMSPGAATWTDTALETLLVLAPSPPYWPAMAWVPTARLLVVRLAWALPFTVPVPSSVSPS